MIENRSSIYFIPLRRLILTFCNIVTQGHQDLCVCWVTFTSPPPSPTGKTNRAQSILPMTCSSKNTKYGILESNNFQTVWYFLSLICTTVDLDCFKSSCHHQRSAYDSKKKKSRLNYKTGKLLERAVLSSFTILSYSHHRMYSSHFNPAHCDTWGLSKFL